MKTQAKHTPTPYKACKSHEDFNGPYFDIEEEDRAEYDAKPYTSIESASGIVCNAHDLFTFKPGDAEFIVEACNSYEAFKVLREVVEYGFGELYEFTEKARADLGLDVLYEKLSAAYNILVTHDEEEANLQNTCKPLTS